MPESSRDEPVRLAEVGLGGRRGWDVFSVSYSNVDMLFFAFFWELVKIFSASLVELVSALLRDFLEFIT